MQLCESLPFTPMALTLLTQVDFLKSMWPTPHSVPSGFRVTSAAWFLCARRSRCQASSVGLALNPTWASCPSEPLTREGLQLAPPPEPGALLPTRTTFLASPGCCLVLRGLCSGGVCVTRTGQAAVSSCRLGFPDLPLSQHLLQKTESDFRFFPNATVPFSMMALMY